MNYQKRPFTLLEICVAISIVVMIASFFGVKSYSYLERYQTQSASNAFHATLLSLQKKALVSDRDHFITIENTPKGILLILMEKGEILKKETFNKVEFAFNNQKDKIELGFSATGVIYPQGKIDLFSKDQKKLHEIDVAKCGVYTKKG